MPLSPMMQQYNSIKQKYKDCLILFRLGDFYELFFDDARLVSQELGLTLTGRNCGLDEKAPMCGVPYMSVNIYASKLVNNGHKVAICEQLSDPETTDGIVERDVVRIITPGTLDNLMSENSFDNVFLASIYQSEQHIGLALTDITTGELIVSEFDDNSNFDTLISELSIYSPKEILLEDNTTFDLQEIIQSRLENIYINVLDKAYYNYNPSNSYILKSFELKSLVTLGINNMDYLTRALESLMHYLLETQKQIQGQIKYPYIKNIGNFMQLDHSAIRNLELVETLYENESKGSLFKLLNSTKTAMGARTLKKIILEPLIDINEINKRLDAVEELINKPHICNRIINSLKNMYDFERLIARVVSRKANPKDLIALKQTLYYLPDIINNIKELNAVLFLDINKKIYDFEEIYNLLEKSILDEPPIQINEGGIIKPGFSQELDDLKSSIKDSKTWIASLENNEKLRTGIKTLKVGYNKVFGYYIDVSKSMIDKIPDDYIRKQTLANNERYVTPELKQKESEVFSAEARINKLEQLTYYNILEQITPSLKQLQDTSLAVALLDALLSLATISRNKSFVRPILNDSKNIEIKAGRHPVIEELLGSGMFISNDLIMDNTDRTQLVITGPNMAGKSTYMRQNALIVLMAQMGCFVPADSAEIGIVDRVFTRIGASDNLAYGQSTFYVEMSELASILRNSTDRSLIILDEIGRGTSTFDGLSIAWASLEYLSKPSLNIRTLFATHYHELTELATRIDTVHNLSVAVKESGNNIVFLHSIVDDKANKSYGIHVAKIAGVPEEIQQNATQKLMELETFQSSLLENSQNISVAETDNSMYNSNSGTKYDTIIGEIVRLNPNNMTPIEALGSLEHIIKEIQSIQGKDND